MKVGNEQAEVLRWKVKLICHSDVSEGHFFSIRMPPVVGVNVVF